MMPNVWLAGLLAVLAATLGCAKKVPVAPPPASNEPQAALMAGELRVRMTGDLCKAVDDRVAGQFLLYASLIPRVKAVKCVSKDGEFHAYVQAYVTNHVEFVKQIRQAIAEVKLPWNAAAAEVRIMMAPVPMIYPASAEDIEVVLDKNKLMIMGVTERDVITQIPKTLADLSESGKAVREHPGTKVIMLKEGKQCFLEDIATVKEVKRPTCLLRFYPGGDSQE